MNDKSDQIQNNRMLFPTLFIAYYARARNETFVQGIEKLLTALVRKRMRARTFRDLGSRM
jgi:hypothetical protein